jgi:hypothetical protein
LLEIFPHTQ